MAAMDGRVSLCLACRISSCWRVDVNCTVLPARFKTVIGVLLPPKKKEKGKMANIVEPAASPPTVATTQSTRYWIDDGSVVFQVGTQSTLCRRELTIHNFKAGSVLYKIHLSHLKQLSSVVRGIFEIPDNTAGPKQGSEEKPILLEFFSPVVFEDFLSWIYRP